MKNLILQAKYWTYLLSYGPNQPLRPSTWRLTSGSDSGGPFYKSLTNLHLTMSQILVFLRTTSTRWCSVWAGRILWFFRPYPARHRATGGSRQTRAGVAAIRVARELAWANYVAFLELRDASTVGVAHYPSTGATAYRKLAPSLMNKETRQLVRQYAPQGWLDD